MPGVQGSGLLLGSTDRRHIDRTGLVADPYVAGSYEEGRYEIDLPVTAGLLATVNRHTGPPSPSAEVRATRRGGGSPPPRPPLSCWRR
ncbi:hypothetical protein D9601_01750 [Sphingomonas sp. MA1305]|uniref:hypothetical protein n=1 Tax=Sphingomonas sp. MA1305 TaxID=2479204 RepID=UPI0018DF056D|nr:hypothetical protein [Sphingomonas sp. MA1305]MBI0474090.1 hypothetical protein [Sphingomonas sp. MA1305]